MAPVLPAEIIALARPSRTASAARTSVESFLRRTPCAASSSIAMTSLASISGRSPMPASPAGPTSTMGMPSAAAAWAAARISPGARSPPIASIAIGSMGVVRRTGRADRRVSRRRRRRDPCTSRTTGTRCAAAWLRCTGGTRCATAPPASTRQHGGCASSSSTSSSWERPPWFSPGRNGLRQVSGRRRHSTTSRRTAEPSVVEQALELVERTPAASRRPRPSRCRSRGCGRRRTRGTGPAVVTAQRRHRRVEHDDLADHRSQIELVADQLERVGIGDDLLVQLVDLGCAPRRSPAVAQRRQMPCHGAVTSAAHDDAVGQRLEVQLDA